MKLVDVKSSTYIVSNQESDHKDPKFEIGDIVRISKYKNIFAKGYTQNWSEEGFVIKNVKYTVRGHMLLMILTVQKLLELFIKKNCKKTNLRNLELKK